MENVTPLLEAQALSKIYSGASVAVGLRRVSLKLYRGEFVAVTGSSGSGKSTLLNVLSALDTYDEGELLFDGEPTSHYTEEDRSEFRRKHVAFIFQDYNVIDSYTVYQNVELALLQSFPDPKARKERIMQLLDAVGLASHVHQRAIKLSGGQKQRVSIARALAKDAPILFADEPCGNLDSATTAEIMQLLADLSKDKLVVMVTHSFDEAAPYATRKLRLADGELVEDQLITSVALPKEDKPQPAPTKKQNFASLVRVAWYNIKATPRRSFFGIFGLIVLTALFLWLGTMAVNNNSASDFRNGYYKNDLQVFLPDRSPLDDDKLAAIRSTEGVEVVFRQNDLLSKTVYYRLGDEDFGGYVRTAESFDGLLYQGRLPQNDEEIVLNLPASRRYSNRNFIGNSVEVYVLNDSSGSTLTMTVVGVTLSNDDTLYVHRDFIEKYRTYYSQEGADRLAIVVCHEGKLSSVRKTLQSQGYTVLHLYGDKIDTGFSAVLSWLELLLYAWATMILYRIIGGSYRSLEAVKRKDFGVMRTVGLSSRFVKSIYYVEMVMQALIGWAVGALAAGISMILFGVFSTGNFAYGFRFLSWWGAPVLWLVWISLFIDLASTLTNALRFNRYFYRQSVKQSQQGEGKQQ